MIKAVGYAAKNSFGNLKPLEFEREEAGPSEIEINILYCGVCHSDIHQVKNEWSNTVYPCMPGHEVVGRVVRVGSSVKRYKVGDLVGVGCMIESCRQCDPRACWLSMRILSSKSLSTFRRSVLRQFYARALLHIPQ